ncbi:MAG: hypothetical protein J0M12_12545 [Deltaproteobacteria bacterium]|nr:hypothetical protein [Deltaproteobacteria bacterium]
MTAELELRQIVKEDPGNPLFAELAEQLRKSGQHAEALDICLSGLSKNPSCHVGRLVLARVFFDRQMFPFAVRELEALRAALPQSKTIAKLLEKLSPGASQNPVSVAPAAPSEAETFAETDFDFEELDLIGQDKKEH